jgi:hypothetical protein
MMEEEYIREYHSKNINAPAGVHVMNKNEAKLCRRLMAETGLSESELREHKKYRVMLSEEQKADLKRKCGKVTSFKKAIMKQVTKELKLPKEHPDCLSLYKEKMLERKKTGYIPWYASNISPNWDLK